MQIGQREKNGENGMGEKKRKEKKKLTSQNDISPAGASEYVREIGREGGRKKRIEKGREDGRGGEGG